jgi:ribonuclease III
VGVEREPAAGGTSFGSLEELLGLPFSKPGLWDVALTHRSYAFEAGLAETNERLEFLGDAVLGVVVTDLAFRRFPEKPEGELAKLRAATVKMSTLADVARELGLGAMVRLGKGEEMSGGRDKASILADCMEAVIGAVYLDKGMDFSRQLIERLFWRRMAEVPPEALDHKMALQEKASRDLGVAPEYRVWSQGPDHAKEFTATVFLKGDEYGAGTGRSKKEAEQQAARQALEVLESRSGGEE